MLNRLRLAVKFHFEAFRDTYGLAPSVALVLDIVTAGIAVGILAMTDAQVWTVIAGFMLVVSVGKIAHRAYGVVA
jgi:hypothetical protein